MSLFRNRRGATLVELIVAILLVSMVLETVYRLYNTNMGIFNAGTDKSKIQQHVKFITDYISKELHYATETEIVSADTVPITISNDDNYIFLNTSGQVAHRNNSGIRIIPASYFDMPVVDLTFRGVNTNLLRYTVIDQKYNYEVNPQIEVKNISDVVTGTNGHAAVRYKTQDSQNLPTPALLEGLSINPGALEQTFNSYRTSYTATVTYETTAVTITPVASTGTIKVQGETVLSGQASAPIDVDVGINTITISISGPNMVTMSYNIFVTREGWILPDPHTGPWVDMNGNWLLDSGVDIPLSVSGMVGNPHQGIYSTTGRLIIPSGNTFNVKNKSLHFSADKGIYIASDIYALNGYSTINLESSGGDISVQPGVRVEAEKSMAIKAYNGNIMGDNATFVNNTGLSDIVLVANGKYISMKNASIESKKKAVFETSADVNMTGASIIAETGVEIDVTGNINMEYVSIKTNKHVTVIASGNIWAGSSVIATNIGQNDINFDSGGYIDASFAKLNAYSGNILFNVGDVDKAVHVNRSELKEKTNTATLAPTGAIIDGTPYIGKVSY